MVRKVYDAEGHLLQLADSARPNPANIGQLTTRWAYDFAGRRVTEKAPDGDSTVYRYDPAGNVDTVITRRGYRLAMTYDALNRLRTRTLPAVSYSLPQSQITPSTGVERNTPYSYDWAVDNQTFQYTAAGQDSIASNRDANVTRTYYPNGRLQSESLEIKKRDRTNGNLYTTTYRYDRNGRRSSVLAPSQFAGDSIRYRYDRSWGAIDSVTDIAGNTFTFSYNGRGDLTGIAYPTGPGIAELFSYDAEGELATDTITNSGGLFPFYPLSRLRAFQVTGRNARGQILTSSDAVMADQVRATYRGLGPLETSNLHQNLFNGITGDPAGYASGDTTASDAHGNVVATAFRDSVYDPVSGWSSSWSFRLNSYTAAGRLQADTLEQQGTSCCDVTTYSYDASGNASFQRTAHVLDVPAERAMYYGPDEKLVATDARRTARVALEEYRYDAFGRRVWVRSGTRCDNPPGLECSTPYVRRTIWDGDQELAEIQVPVDTLNAAVEELDTGYPLQYYYTYGDPNPFYGRVVYGPGLAVDQPLSVTRYEYRDNPHWSSLTWPRFTWQIYWNYQGLPAYGTLTTGAWAYPYQLGQNQDRCPIRGDTSMQRCVFVQWPLMHSAYDLNRGNVTYPSWHGSLLEGRRDRSGLEYKRNRQYDPRTGRFTQEDPIGLAGGLNLYGFANGDPVNFGDPFGLCTGKNGEQLPPDQCRPVSGQEGQKIYDAAGAEGQWTWTEGKKGQATKDVCKNKGDCTDFVEASMEGAGLPTLNPRPSTGEFGTSDDYQLVTGQPQAGDVIIQGGHAGIFSGTYDAKKRPLGIQNGGSGTKIIPWGRGVRGLPDADPVYYRRLIPR